MYNKESLKRLDVNRLHTYQVSWVGEGGGRPCILLFFIARSASPACASAGYSKNLRKPANVSDRSFPQPQGGLPMGVASF